MIAANPSVRGWLRTRRRWVVWSLIFTLPAWLVAGGFTLYVWSSVQAWQSVRGLPEVLVATFVFGWYGFGVVVAYFIGPRLPRGPPDPKEFL